MVWNEKKEQKQKQKEEAKERQLFRNEFNINFEASKGVAQSQCLEGLNYFYNIMNYQNNLSVLQDFMGKDGLHTLKASMVFDEIDNNYKFVFLKGDSNPKDYQVFSMENYLLKPMPQDKERYNYVAKYIENNVDTLFVGRQAVMFNFNDKGRNSYIGNLSYQNVTEWMIQQEQITRQQKYDSLDTFYILNCSKEKRPLYCVDFKGRGKSPEDYAVLKNRLMYELPSSVQGLTEPISERKGYSVNFKEYMDVTARLYRECMLSKNFSKQALDEYFAAFDSKILYCRYNEFATDLEKNVDNRTLDCTAFCAGMATIRENMAHGVDINLDTIQFRKDFQGYLILYEGEKDNVNITKINYGIGNFMRTVETLNKSSEEYYIYAKQIDSEGPCVDNCLIKPIFRKEFDIQSSSQGERFIDNSQIMRRGFVLTNDMTCEVPSTHKKIVVEKNNFINKEDYFNAKSNFINFTNGIPPKDKDTYFELHKAAQTGINGDYIQY